MNNLSSDEEISFFVSCNTEKFINLSKISISRTELRFLGVESGFVNPHAIPSAASIINGNRIKPYKPDIIFYPYPSNRVKVYIDGKPVTGELELIDKKEPYEYIFHFDHVISLKSVKVIRLEIGFWIY